MAARMARALYFVHGVVVYVLFLGAFLYAIGFVENFHCPLFGRVVFVPRSIDLVGSHSSLVASLLIDAAL